MVANFKWFASIHFFSPRTMHEPLICTKPFHQQVTLQVWVIVVENLKKMSLDCSGISIRLTHEQPQSKSCKTAAKWLRTRTVRRNVGRLSRMLFCYKLSLKLKRRRRAIIFPCNLSQTHFGDSSCHGRQHKIESSRRLPYCEYVSELERYISRRWWQ